jgi:hypothetical protein
MSAPYPKSGACECGQVVFDLTGRKTGEILNCNWCGRKFRYMGNERLTALTPEEARLAEAGVKQGRAARSGQKRTGPPGGIWPMIGFIVVSNALAFGAFALLLPKGDDGLRHTIWESDFTVPGRALWPDLCALAAGHVFGFCCWAVFVFWLHKRARAGR